MWNKLRYMAAPLLALTLLSAAALRADEPAAEPITTEAIQEISVDPSAPPTLTPADVNAWIDGFMPYAMASGDIAGAVVTVVKDGQIVANRGFGFSDLEKRTPVDPDRTLFRPGSVSKLFTWTAVMQLVERGKIELDADVNTYLDFEIPDYRGAPLTMRQILTHTSGFEEVVRDLIVSDPAAGSVALGDYLRENIPARIHPPGTMPAYSNYATALAGYIVERVSGTPFAEFVRQNIFDPLGMRNSTFVQPVPEELRPEVSLGYRNIKDGKPQPFEIIPAAPAGAASTSGADMARFMNAHLAHGAGLMQPETARLMHETVDQQFPGVNSMVLGFYRDDMNGHRIIAHGGDTQWFHSNLALLLDQNTGVYVSVNSQGAPTLGTRLLRRELMSGFMNRYFPGPPAAEPVALPTAREHGALVAGDYDSARRAETNPVLALYFAGQTSVKLLPDGDLIGPGIPNINGAPKHWREVEPWVWQAVGSDERMGARVADGRVTAIAFEPLAFAIPSTRAPWWRSKSLLLPLLAAAGVVFALTLLAWPIRAISRRAHRAPFPYQGERARAHRIAPVVALLILAYFGAWAWFLTWVIESLSGAGSRLPLAALYVAGVIPLAVVAGTAWVNRALWRGHSRWFSKAWAALLLLSSLIALWFAVAMRFYSFDFTF